MRLVIIFHYFPSHNNNMYMHMASGCGHCKSLAPAYEEVGRVFDNVESVLIAKVDTDSERDLGSRFDV